MELKPPKKSFIGEVEPCQTEPKPGRDVAALSWITMSFYWFMVKQQSIEAQYEASLDKTLRYPLHIPELHEPGPKLSEPEVPDPKFG